MEFFGTGSVTIFFQLFIALVLGALLGIERVMAHKTAGMRTYALVSMGAALFVIVSQYVGDMANASSFVIMQIPAAIVTGIGFLGAGLIIFKDDKLSGLTSAAGLWVTAGIGIAIGFKFYFIAFVSTLLTLLIFTVLWYVENALKRMDGKIFSLHNEQEAIARERGEIN